MEDDAEISFCYLEGSVVDNQAAEEVSELHENVWYRMKPPTPKKAMYDDPFVSARKIDLIRNTLLGKNALKVFDYQAELIKRKEEEEAIKAARAAAASAKEVKEKPCIKLKKSSVKFLNKTVYD